MTDDAPVDVGEQFHLEPQQGKLAGDTGLFQLTAERANGEVVDVAPEDDEFMAMVDALYIVEQLRLWSAQHQLAWVLNFAGEEVGRISNGKHDARLDEWLAGMREAVGVGDAAENERRAKEIVARYS